MISDIELAQKYVLKHQVVTHAGGIFDLSFTSFKNMYRAKRCGYTGVLLTHKRKSKSLRETDITVDRIDNSKGYVNGNVIAVCHAANRFKGQLENPNNVITAKEALAIAKIMLKVEK